LNVSSILSLGYFVDFPFVDLAIVIVPHLSVSCFVLFVFALPLLSCLEYATHSLIRVFI
jgi:hypothetical protein